MKRMLLFIFISCLFVLIGCSGEASEKVLRYQENSEIIGPEKDELIGDISETIYESIDRSNSKAEEIMIHPIEGPGEDVIPPEGRYTIYAAVPLSGSGSPQSGRVLIYDENESLLIEEVLDPMFGVGSVTVDLNGSHTVHVDGINQALITPAATEISNELTAGIWEVGKDIEAGEYSVFPGGDFAFGYLHIFEEGESPRVFEFLNSLPESKVKVQLTDGQKIRISSLYLLQFEAQS